MLAQNIKQGYLQFSATAESLLHIADEAHYQQALSIVEELMADDKDSDATEGLITLLSHAISEFESRDDVIVNFHNDATNQHQDISMLRFLMSHAT